MLLSCADQPAKNCLLLCWVKKGGGGGGGGGGGKVILTLQLCFCRRI